MSRSGRKRTDLSKRYSVTGDVGEIDVSEYVAAAAASGSADPLNDAELIRQLAVGDAHALAALVGRYLEPLVRFAYYILRSRDAAEDVVQDVFIRIWEQPETLDPSRSLKPYLFTAVRNRALNEQKYEAVRTRHKETVLAEAEAQMSQLRTPSPEESVLNETTVQAALRTLPDRRQLAVRLRIEEQMTHAEVGQTLGISAMAAERLVLRALEDLRRALRVSGSTPTEL